MNAEQLAALLDGGANDPMWADHCEMSKRTVSKAAALLRAQAAELADIKESFRSTVAGECAPDELHCSCVPALRQEIEALRKDAERYRWLRDVDSDPVCSLAQLFTTTGDSKDVDACIDDAMEAK